MSVQRAYMLAAVRREVGGALSLQQDGFADLREFASELAAPIYRFPRHPLWLGYLG